MPVPSWYLDGQMLRRLAAAEEDGRSLPEAWAEGLEVLDISDHRVDVLAQRLVDAGYVDAVLSKAWGGEIALFSPNYVTPNGLRAAGFWPSVDATMAEVVGVLRLVASELEGEERSRVDRVIDSIEALDKQMIAQVLTALLGVVGR